MNRFRVLIILLLLIVTSACQQADSPSSSLYLNGNESAIFGGQKLRKGHKFLLFTVGITYEGEGDKESLCTGAMLSPELVLTAAHCVSSDLKTMRIYFTPNLDEPSEVASSLVRRVKSVRVHPLYEEAGKDKSKATRYDIAVLRLTTKAPDFVRHFILAPRDFPISKKAQAYIAGYGRESLNSRTDESTGDQQIKAAIGKRKESHIEGILVMDQTGDTGICAGDSGGPLFLLDGSTKGFVLIGIASQVWNGFEEDACRGESYFVSVAGQREWIYQQAFELMQTHW